MQGLESNEKILVFQQALDYNSSTIFKGGFKSIINEVNSFIAHYQLFFINAPRFTQKSRKQNINGIKGSKTITDAVKLYRNDLQLQTEVDNSVKNQPEYLEKVNLAYKKITCPNDPNYKYVVITKPQKVSSVPNKLKKQVIISCNVHARELITSEVCVDFISQISKALSNSHSQTQQNSDIFTFNAIDSLLSTTKLTVFYRGNQMRDTVLSGKDYCIRKDKNNIDINRNFPTNFNFQNHPSYNEEYPGKQPLTEPFSKCLDNYLQQINKTKKINVYVDIHTGEFTLFNSYESENNQTRPILQKIQQKYCPQCRITSLGQQKDDEVASGQIFTDIKKRYKADHSILMEIYGGYNQNLNTQQNCIAIFNPLTKRELDYYRSIWAKALLEFVKESLSKSN